MREILFRGKVKLADGERWVYGNLYQSPTGQAFIQEGNGKGTCEVDPETVGQYTGLKDKNGTKIFEGDKVCGYNFMDNSPYNDIGGIVTFGLGGFCILDIIADCAHRYWEDYKLEVIGNIYDNPELLEVLK